MTVVSKNFDYCANSVASVLTIVTTVIKYVRTYMGLSSTVLY